MWAELSNAASRRPSSLTDRGKGVGLESGGYEGENNRFGELHGVGLDG